MKIPRKFAGLLTVLNLVALAATIYLTYMHFKPDASTICNISEGFNCDIVNKSPYAEIFGIPVSILGFFNYLLLLGFSIRSFFKDQTKWIPYIFGLVSLGVLFSLYLSGIEAFVLYTWCIFCVIQQIIILLEWGIFFYLYKLTKKL